MEQCSIVGCSDDYFAAKSSSDTEDFDEEVDPHSTHDSQRASNLRSFPFSDPWRHAPAIRLAASGPQQHTSVSAYSRAAFSLLRCNAQQRGRRQNKRKPRVRIFRTRSFGATGTFAMRPFMGLVVKHHFTAANFLTWLAVVQGTG